MSEAAGPDAVPVAVARRLDQVCDRFEAAWKAAGGTVERPRIEDYLGDVPEPERAALVRELIVVEVEQRYRAGETLRLEDYRARFPMLPPHWLAGVLHCERAAEAMQDHPERTGPWQAGAAAALVEAPEQVGRYRVERILGQGGFGIVYLAYDEQLSRLVASRCRTPIW